MRCDLCAKGSEAGPVLLLTNPDPPAFERRKEGPRHQHQECADNKRLVEAEEKAMTVRWAEDQFEAFAAARRLAGVS